MDKPNIAALQAENETLRANVSALLSELVDASHARLAEHLRHGREIAALRIVLAQSDETIGRGFLWQPMCGERS